MICEKCGADIGEAKFCTECGTKVDENEKAEKTEATLTPVKEEKPAPEAKSDDTSEGEEKSSEVEEALHNLKTYETGSIPDPDDKPEKKHKAFCWRNPVLAQTLELLAFAAALAIADVIFFNIEIEGSAAPVYRFGFLAMAIAVFAIDIIFYLRPAYMLDKMLKGKNVSLEYKLKNYELVQEAEKAKKKNRGFYLALALFGLAFGSYYAYLIISTGDQPSLMTVKWIFFWFSTAVFVIASLFFFLMPKINYNRMMENGGRVIIGEKAVYYGGRFYWWFNVEPKLTFGKYNPKSHILTLNFAKAYKNGTIKKEKLELFAPERELKGVTKLLSLYEVSVKEYQLKQQRNSILADSGDEKKDK